MKSFNSDRIDASWYLKEKQRACKYVKMVAHLPIYDLGIIITSERGMGTDGPAIYFHVLAAIPPPQITNFICCKSSLVEYLT